MVRLTGYLSIIFLISIAPLGTIKAAEVSCGFIAENTFSRSWEWLAHDDDWQKLLKMFPEGISISLETTLDRKLDSTKVFFAGEVEQGKVYLRGTQYGVDGKLVKVKGEQVFVYDGACSVN